MTNQNKEINWDKIGVISLFVVICIFVFFMNVIHQITVQSKHYTIAKIHKISSNDGIFYVEYIYKVNNWPYDGSGNIPTKDNNKWIYNPKVGERYYVKFLKKARYISVICLDKQVPDSIKEPPKEGWLGDLNCSEN